MIDPIWTVFKTTHIPSGMIYIGVHKTRRPNDWYLGSGRTLTRAVKAHGKQEFKKEILFIYDNPDDAHAKEEELVDDAFAARKDTYNLTKGGRGRHSCEGESNSQHGTVWVSRGDQERKVRKQQLAEHLADGWARGRSPLKRGVALSNLEQTRHGTTNGKVAVRSPQGEVRFVSPCEVSSFLAKGWVTGHGATPSEESLQKLREKAKLQRAHQASPTKARVRVYKEGCGSQFVPYSELACYLDRGFLRGMSPEEREHISRRCREAKARQASSQTSRTP